MKSSLGKVLAIYHSSQAEKHQSKSKKKVIWQQKETKKK